MPVASVRHNQLLLTLNRRSYGVERKSGWWEKGNEELICAAFAGSFKAILPKRAEVSEISLELIPKQ